MEKENNIIEFFKKYVGAILGGIIAIILVCTGLFKVVAGLVIIIAGVFVGNYVQNNKEYVKEKLKELIDKF